MRDSIVLALFASGLCTAQALPPVLVYLSPEFADPGYVTNAVGTSDSAFNVVAPEMLANLQSYSFDFSLSLLQSGPASVFLRPAGSLMAIPATVVPVQLLPISGFSNVVLSFLVPAGIPTGSAELIWSSNGGTYQFIAVQVAPNNFELTRNGPNGSALAQTLSATPGYSVGLATPASPGQIIALTGSGLGYGTSVTASVGGLPAPVIYAGRGTPAGMDQIQLQIPPGVVDSCYAPLVLNVGQSVITSTLSNTATGNSCPHPFHLPLSDLVSLDGFGSLNVVEVDLSTNLYAALSSSAYRSENVSVTVEPLTASQIQHYFATVALTGCVSRSPGIVPELVRGFNPVLQSGATLDTGNPLTLTIGSNTFISQQTNFQYFTLPSPMESSLVNPPAPLIAPGAGTLNTPGSNMLPASSFRFTLPAPVQLSSPSPITLSRGQSQTVTWNGAAFDPQATAQISLSSDSHYLSCTAAAHSGSLTIPAALLAAFPAASLGSLSIYITPGPQAISTALFKTTAGQSVPFIAVYTTSDNRPVDFQ